MAFGSTVTRALKRGVRAVTRGNAVALAVLVAIVAVVALIVRRLAREGIAPVEDKNSCSANSYFDADLGMCRTKSYCKKKKGSLIKASGGGYHCSYIKGAQCATGKYWDPTQNNGQGKCMTKKNCRAKGGTVRGKACVTKEQGPAVDKLRGAIKDGKLEQLGKEWKANSKCPDAWERFDETTQKCECVKKQGIVRQANGKCECDQGNGWRWDDAKQKCYWPK